MQTESPQSDLAATAPPERRLRMARLLGMMGVGVFVLTWYCGLGGADARLLAIPFLAAGLGLIPARAWAGERTRLLEGLGRIPPAWYYGVLSLVAGAVWVAVYVLMYQRFALSTYDTGIYGNVAANCARGEWMYSSFLERNDLGEHFSPVMLLFAPLYALKPGIGWLLGAQLAAYLAVPPLLQGCVPGPESRKRRGTGYLVGLLWYFYGPMAAAMYFPFHPSSLGGPVLVAAFLMLQRRRWVAMCLLLALSLGFKENFALVVIGFGLYAAFCSRQRLLGAGLVAAGCAAGYVLIAQVIPAFREGPWTGHMSRLGALEDLPEKGVYVLALLAPLGFLPLLQWRSGVLALPAIVLNLATQYGAQYSGRYHYDDVAAVLLFLALADSLGRPGRWRRLAEGRAGLVFGAAWVGAAVFLAADPPLRYVRRHIGGAVPYGEVHAQLRRIDALDEKRRVVVQSHLGPALNRANVRVLLTENAPLDTRRLSAGDLVVLMPGINAWGLKDGDAERQIQAFRDSGEFVSIPDYAPLAVFEKR